MESGSLNKQFSGLLITVGMIFLISPGCDRLAVEESLENENYELTDQNRENINFPSNYLGNVLLVGYVYTHCPDICPVITYNMRDVQRELAGENEFMLISVSFDPDRDTPEILYSYAENYRLNQENWRLLTGDKRIVESLLGKLRISTVKTPTRFSDNNTPIYFIDHTDKVTLIDKIGQVRRTYSGSEFVVEEVTEDIRLLLKE